MWSCGHYPQPAGDGMTDAEALAEGEMIADEVIEFVRGMLLQPNPLGVIHHLAMALGRQAAEMHGLDENAVGEEVCRAGAKMGVAATMRMMAMVREIRSTCAGTA